MGVTDRLTCGIHGRVTGICHLCADERHNRDLTAALAAKERAEAALAEHKHSFDLRWQADQRARALWRKDRPDRDMIWPDHADLCVWLLEQRDALAAKLAEAERLQLKQSTPPIVRYTLDISDGRMVKSPDGFWASAYELAAAYTTIATLTSKLAEAEKDAERLRAIAKHGWYIVRDIEGDWQVKSPRRYGAPVIVAEAMSLHLAIDAAISQERSDEH